MSFNRKKQEGSKLPQMNVEKEDMLHSFLGFVNLAFILYWVLEEALYAMGDPFSDRQHK